MNFELLKRFGIELVTTERGDFVNFKTNSEINDGIMVSKDQFYIFGMLISFISEGKSADFLKGWLHGYPSQSHLTD